MTVKEIKENFKTDREKLLAIFLTIGNESEIKINEKSINFEGKRYEFDNETGDLLRIIK